MKKTYKLLAFLILPMQSIAQPVLTNPEFYTTNTIVRRVICEPEAAGPSGANQTWDFTGLSATTDTLVQQVVPPVTGNPFPSANIALFSPADTAYTHYEQTTAETLQWGIVDSSVNQSSIVYSDPMLMMRRPATYGDTTTDSFAYVSDFSGFTVEAWGGLSVEADAYGTLYLPNDTFTNALRLRIHHQEQDSIDGVGMLYLDNVFYVWYSDEFASPVLRVDSMTLSGLANQTFVDVQYLLKEADVTDVRNIEITRKVQCNAHLDNNGLLMNGSLEAGKQYEVALFGINGQQVYKSGFVATGEEQRCAIDHALSSGTYILTIRKKGDVNSFNVIKVVKE